MYSLNVTRSSGKVLTELACCSFSGLFEKLAAAVASAESDA
jgi:hypothetical protein